MKLWGVMGPSFAIFFLLSILAAFNQSAWFVLAAIVAAWFGCGYIVGLADILFHPVREMDIIIEPLGIGFLAGRKRWYVHMDGVISIQKLTANVWTISHHNGTVINVPTESMPDECIAHIRHTIAEKWNYLQQFADAHRRKLEAEKQE